MKEEQSGLTSESFRRELEAGIQEAVVASQNEMFVDPFTTAQTFRMLFSHYRKKRDVLVEAGREGYLDWELGTRDIQLAFPEFSAEREKSKLRWVLADCLHAYTKRLLTMCVDLLIEQACAVGMEFGDIKPLHQLRGTLRAGEGLKPPPVFGFFLEPPADIGPARGNEVEGNCQKCAETIKSAAEHSKRAPSPCSVARAMGELGSQLERLCERISPMTAKPKGSEAPARESNRRRGRTPIKATADHRRWHKAYCDAGKAGGRVDQKELARKLGVAYPEFRRVIKRLESRRKTQK